MEEIKRFLSYGYGDGSGYGDGDGYGYGDGSGYGDGDGYGYGSGDGYGDGYGDGSGYDIKSINGNTVYLVDKVPTLIDHVHGNVAKGRILRDDLTTKACYIVKSGNLFAHGETLHKAMQALDEKLFEDMPVEERIEVFLKKFPGDGKYPVKAFFDWHNRLTGSCEMGRKAFAQEHGIDIENGEMTVDEFIRLTRNAYGGEVIRKLEKSRGRT